MLADVMQPGIWDYTPAPVREYVQSPLRTARPRMLVDVGAASGAIALDWCAGAPDRAAIAIEPAREPRALLAANIRRNGADVRVIGERFALDHLPAEPVWIWLGCISFISIALIDDLCVHPGVAGIMSSHHRSSAPMPFLHLLAKAALKTNVVKIPVAHAPTRTVLCAVPRRGLNP